MGFHKFMGWIGGFFTILGFIPYIRSILRGKTVPKRASWAIWTVIGWVIFATYYASGSRNNLPEAFAIAIGPTVVFLFSLKRGEGGSTWFDWFCILGAALSLCVWKGFEAPVLGLSGGLLTDFLGLLLTWRHLYEKPDSEEPEGWILWNIGNFFNLFTIERWTIQDALFPLYFFVGTGVSLFLIVRGWSFDRWISFVFREKDSLPASRS